MPLPHVYGHLDISADLVSNFANAPQDEQIRALRILRVRSEYQASDTISVTLGLSVAFLTMMFAILVSVDASRISDALSEVGLQGGLGLPAWARLTITAVVFLLGPLGWTFAVFVGLSRIREERARAATWLRFYEEELRRREGERGLAAWRWRKAHPINWQVVEKPAIDELNAFSLIRRERPSRRDRRRTR